VGGCAGACRDSLAKIQLLAFAFIRYAVWPEVRLSEGGGSIKPLPPVRSKRIDMNQLQLTREIREKRRFVSPQGSRLRILVVDDHEHI